MRDQNISELNSVHGVKILLCFLLDKLSRSVEEDELGVIARESGVVNYFYFADALNELKENGAVTSEKGLLAITEKGRMGSEYFNKNISLVYRKRLLETALHFFSDKDRRSEDMCTVSETEQGFNVNFRLPEKDYDLINMSFYAPEREQAERIAVKLRSDPLGAYKKILEYLLTADDDRIDVNKYL